MQSGFHQVPQNLEEWEAMRMEHVTSKEYLQAEEVAEQIRKLASDYDRGLILADDYVAAVQRIVLM